MGLNLTQLREELYNALGVDTQDLIEAKADLYINRSFWEILNKFAFREKEISTNFTIDNTNGPKYTLPVSFEALLDVTIQDPITSQFTALDRMTKVVYDSVYNTDQTTDPDAFAQPTSYIRDNDCIIFWPTPDQEYTTKLRFLRSLDDISEANSTLPIPREWHEIVLMGAIWRGFMGLGDYERVERCKAQQLSLVTSTVPVEAKEEFDTHLGGVEVPGRVVGGRL